MTKHSVVVNISILDLSDFFLNKNTLLVSNRTLEGSREICDFDRIDRYRKDFLYFSVLSELFEAFWNISQDKLTNLNRENAPENSLEEGAPDILRNASKDSLDRIELCQKLWTQCEGCDHLNYTKFLKSNMLYICEHCGYHLKMKSLDRIDLLVDRDTWDPFDEHMVSIDINEWDCTDIVNNPGFHRPESSADPS